MKEKIYLAGKITGLSDYKEIFEAYKKYVEVKYDADVMSPHVLPSTLSKSEAMKICLSMIDVCDKLFFLPNYMESEGAAVEHKYAQYVGKTIVYLPMLMLNRKED